MMNFSLYYSPGFNQYFLPISNMFVGYNGQNPANNTKKVTLTA